MKRHLLALLTLSSSFFGLTAFAADTSVLAPAVASQRSAEQAEQVVGVGLGYGNHFFGGKTEWQAGLFGEANFANGVFLSTRDGLGYRFLNNNSGFSAAASIGPSGWRKESYGKNDGTNRLKGMGDVELRAQANLFVNYDAGAFHVNTALHQTMGDRHDMSLDVVGRYDVLSTKTDLVDVSAGLSYANKSDMGTYFGVTPAQSASSGNAVYTPKAGIAGYGIGATWRHEITQNWVSTVSTGVTRLGSAASDSPLSDRRTSAGIGATIGYRF
ncbi:hypothetical protein BH11PSE12_BH11PSE12_09220 [soil metagenome]